MPSVARRAAPRARSGPWAPAALFAAVVFTIAPAPATLAAPRAENDVKTADAIAQRVEAYLAYVGARGAMLEGRDADAAALLREVLILDPEASRVHAALAELCLRMRDPDCAERSARRALELPGSDVEAHRVLAQLTLGRFYRDGTDPDLEAGLGHLREAARIDPRDPTTWTLLIGVLAQERRFEDAAREAGRAASVPGADPARPWILLSKSMLSAGRREDAIRLLESTDLPGHTALPVLRMLADLKGAVRDWDGQIDVLRRLQAMLPDDPGISHQLGGALYRVGDTHAALAALESAADARGEDPLVLRDLGRALFAVGRAQDALETFARLPEVYLTPPTMILQAFAAEQAGRDGEAGALWESAAEKARAARDAPRENAARRRGGEVLLRAGDPERALALIGPLEGNDARLLSLRVGALEAAGRGREARETLDGVLDRRPRDPVVHAILAAREADVAGDDAAVATLLAALGGQPDSVLALHRVARNLLIVERAPLAARIVDAAGLPSPPDPETLEIRGRALALAGRTGEAEAAWRRLLELRPDDAGAMNELGYLLATERRSLDEAVRLLERAVESKPRSGSYLDSLGWALHVSGEPDRALPLLRQAVGLADASEMGVIREHLGDVYDALGDAERALAEWRAARAFGSEDPERLQRKIEERSRGDAR